LSGAAISRILATLWGGAMATIFLAGLVFYLAAGLLIGVAFVVAGVTVVQPAPVTIGARMLLLPGAVALWPLVLSRWLGHTQR
jgi:phosphoglycerol transferase MdoB-like AlkP superfamily enzyme